jgi:hypothetical protein
MLSLEFTADEPMTWREKVVVAETAAACGVRVAHDRATGRKIRAVSPNPIRLYRFARALKKLED